MRVVDRLVITGNSDRGHINLVPMAQPSGANSGGVYMGTDGVLRVHTGDGWEQLASPTSLATAGSDVRAAVERISTPGLLYGERLSRWRSRLAEARFRQVHIAVAGDSISVGAYSNNNAAIDDPVWRVRGWVPQLRALFADRYGDPGEGFIRAANFNRWTFGGGANSIESSSAGVFREHIPLDAVGETVTITTTVCTDIIIHLWYGNTGQLIYSVDGGGDVTAPASSGTDTMYAVRITGLAATTHTLVMKKPATGNASIIGISCLNGVSSGVVVHRVAESGMMLKDFTKHYDANDAAGDRSLNSASKLVWTADGAAAAVPDLYLLAFSANNVTKGWNTYGQTPAQVAAGYGLVMDHLIAGGTDVVFVAGPQRDPASYSIPYTQADYDAAIIEQVASREHAAVINITDVWGTWAVADALGLYWDTVHPSLRGHSHIAHLIYTALGGV